MKVKNETKNFDFECVHYRKINKKHYLGRIPLTTGFFVRSFSSSESEFPNLYMSYPFPDNPDSLKRLINNWDPAKINNLRIIKITPPHLERLKEQRIQANMKTLATIYGADKRTERLVYYELNGKYSYSGFSFFQYKGKWCIENMNSIIGSTPPLGDVSECSPSHMEKWIK